MDFAKTGLSNDAAEVAVTTHKKCLSLEARHSKAIESARKIRLNLTASIFIPKIPQKSSKNYPWISSTKLPKRSQVKPVLKPSDGLMPSLKTAKNIKIVSLQKTLQRVKRKLNSNRNLKKEANTKKRKPRIIEKYRKILRKVNRDGIKTKMKTLPNNCDRSQMEDKETTSDDAIENALKSMGLEVSSTEDPEIVTISQSTEDIFQSLSLELSTGVANARETKTTPLVKANTKDEIETIIIEDCHEDQATSPGETNTNETMVIEECPGGQFNIREEPGDTPEHQLIVTEERRDTPVERTTTNDTIRIEEWPGGQINIRDERKTTPLETANTQDINATIVIADWPGDQLNITEEHGDETNTKDTNETIVTEEYRERQIIITEESGAEKANAKNTNENILIEECGGDRLNITEKRGPTPLEETDTKDTNETIVIEEYHQGQFNITEGLEAIPLETTTTNENHRVIPFKETDNTNEADNCQTTAATLPSLHQSCMESSKNRKFQDVMKNLQYYFNSSSVDEEIYGIKTKMKTLPNNCDRSQMEEETMSDDAIENARKTIGLDVSILDKPEKVTISESTEDIFQSLSLKLSTSFSNAQERYLRDIAKENRETNTKDEIETIIIEDCHEAETTSLDDNKANETIVLEEVPGGQFNITEVPGDTPEHQLIVTEERRVTPVEETTTNEKIRGQINIRNEGKATPLETANTQDINATIVIEEDHQGQFNITEGIEVTPLDTTNTNEAQIIFTENHTVIPLKETDNTNEAENCQTTTTTLAPPHQFYTESFKNICSYNESLHSVREFQDVMKNVQYYFNSTSVDEEIYGNLRCLQDSINEFSIFLQKTYMDMDLFEEEQRQIYQNIAITCTNRQVAEIPTEFVVRIDVPEMPEQILTFRATDIIQCTLENCEKSDKIRRKRAEKREKASKAQENTMQTHLSNPAQVEPVKRSRTTVISPMSTGTHLLAPQAQIHTTREGHTTSFIPHLSAPAHQFQIPIHSSEIYTTANVHPTHRRETSTINAQHSPVQVPQQARNTDLEPTHRNETSEDTTLIINGQSFQFSDTISKSNEHASYGIENLPTTLNAPHLSVPRQNQQFSLPAVLPNSTTTAASSNDELSQVPTHQSLDQNNTEYNNTSQTPPQYNLHPAYRNEIPTIGIPTSNVQNISANQRQVPNSNNLESNNHPMYRLQAQIANHTSLSAPSAHRSERLQAFPNSQYSPVPAPQSQVPNRREQHIHPAFRQESLYGSSNSQYNRVSSCQCHVPYATSKTQYSPAPAHQCQIPYYTGPNPHPAYRSETLQVTSNASHSPVPAHQSHVLSHSSQNIHPAYRGEALYATQNHTQPHNYPQTETAVNVPPTEPMTTGHATFNVQQSPQVTEHAQRNQQIPLNPRNLAGPVPQQYVTPNTPPNTCPSRIKTKVLTASRMSNAKRNSNKFPHQQSKSSTQVPPDSDDELQKSMRSTVIKRKAPCSAVPPHQSQILNNRGQQPVPSNNPTTAKLIATLRMRSDKRRKVESPQAIPGQQTKSPAQSPQNSESNLLFGEAIANARDQLSNSLPTTTVIKAPVDSDFRKPTIVHSTRTPHYYPINAEHLSNAVPSVANTSHASLTYNLQSVDSQQNTILRSTLPLPSYPIQPSQTREQHFINSHLGAFTTNPLLTPPQSVDGLPSPLYRPAAYNAYPTFDPLIGVPMTPPSDDPVRQDGTNLNPAMLAATFGVYNLDGRPTMYKEMIYPPPPPGPTSHWEDYQP